MRSYIFIGIAKLFLIHNISTMDLHQEHQSPSDDTYKEDDAPLSLPSSSASFFATEFKHFDPSLLTPATSEENMPFYATPTIDQEERYSTQQEAEQMLNISLFQKKIYFKKWKKQYTKQLNKKFEQEWDLADDAKELTDSQTTTAFLATTTPFSQTTPLNSIMKSWSWLNEQMQRMGSK